MTKRYTTPEHHVDLYLAGFPCQPFSTSGKRKGTSDFRGKVVYSVINTTKASLPKCFILENVAGLVNADGGTLFNKIVK